MKSITLMMELLKRKPSCRKAQLPYRPDKDSKIRINENEKENVVALMKIVQDELGDKAFDINVSSSNLIRISAFTLGNIKFDIDAGTKNLKKLVEESGIHSRRTQLWKTLDAM